MRKALFCLALVAGMLGYGQEKSPEQRDLEGRKAALAKEIAQISIWVKEQQTLRGSVVDRIRILERKQKALETLIALSAREVQYLQRQIDQSSLEVRALSDELEQLKEDYAKVIKSA